MLGFVSAVAVATILAVVSALTLSTSGAIAHDFYVNWVKRGQVDGKQEVWIARIATVVIGVLAIALGILAQGVNVAVLVILAICVAASANFPVLILSLFWRRFNTGGVVGGMTVGLISSVVLAMIGPAMRGADALWPLVNPTVVSLPLGFLRVGHADLRTRRRERKTLRRVPATGSHRCRAAVDEPLRLLNEFSRGSPRLVSLPHNL